MKRGHLFCAAATLIGLAILSSWAVSDLVRASHGQTPRRTHVSWVYKTSDPGEMARHVDAIVLGTLTHVYPGRVAYSSNGEDALAFELNDIAVDEVIKGSDLGATITIERVATTQGERTAVFDHDGGPFLPRTRYLLFLKKQADATSFIQINDEGRYALDRNGRLLSSGSGKVADALEGRRLTDVRAFLGEALRTR